MAKFSLRAIFRSASGRVAGFGDNIRGNTAILFAGAMIPLMGMIGAAVDYTNASRTRVVLQESLDAAVLAGAAASAAGKTSSEVETIVDNYIKANFSSTQNLNPKTTITVDKAGGVTGKVTLDVPMKIMPVMGIPTMQITNTSKASYGAGKIEMALVFDTTYSMVGAKLDAAKLAAKSLIATLYADSSAKTRVKVSLVPFSYYVNVGLGYRNESWITGAQDYSNTTYECWDEYPNATYTNPVPVTATCYNDGVPYDCSYTSYTVNYGAPVKKCGNYTATYTWYGCVGSRNYPLDTQDVVDSTNRIPALLNYSCASPLMRLTNAKNSLDLQIDALVPQQDTYIAPGIIWGWRTLSPNAPFSDGAAYGKTTQKIMVVLTDGANTHSPNYPNHEGTDVAIANQRTVEVCDKVKATGITVYTIAFAVTDATIKNILQNCASGPPRYYDANTIGDMQAAFANIGAQLTAVRLTN